MTGGKSMRVGSRKSELALIQTKHVISRLQKNFPHKKFEIHTMSTIGDRVLNISLPKIGEKSLFTRDLEEALRTGGVDFVVHSLKDLPTALPAGMAIGAILEREDARDALVLRSEFKGHTIDTLPKGSVIGTSSLRRTAQIRRQYPHLQVCDIRGNLNTRLAKLDAVDSKYAGIVLAQAGLMRMGWLARISQVLEPVELLYAVGQGALAVECRANDAEVLGMLRSLLCLSTTCRILAERSFLKTLGGGCSAPVAVCSTLCKSAECDANSQRLCLTGAVWSLDGITQIRDELSCNVQNAETNSVEHDDQEPRAKRVRKTEVIEQQQQVEDKDNNNSSSNDNNSSTSSTSSDRSCEIINEDANLEEIVHNYNIQELLEKHMDLAKQCPIVGGEPTKCPVADVGATGDAGVDKTAHCPLTIEVGQDVMGECPFVGKEEKVAIASCGKCPITGNTAQPQTATKCPFNVNKSSATATATKTTTATSENVSDGEGLHVGVAAAHAKCPFLQQASKVQMYDYEDEDKPQPSNRCLDDVPLTARECLQLDESLFCGFYAHACYNRDVFAYCHKLGQQLAEQLIKRGALQVMKCAQNEIHSKIQQ